MKRVQTIAILILFWICAVLITTPAFANTEYMIPNSSIVVGVSSTVGLNVSYSIEQPAIGVKVYSDTINETWCITPEKAPDGLLDIVIVPVKQSGFWEWLTSWI